MKKLFIILFLLFAVGLTSFAADFKGFSFGNLAVYFPSMQIKHVEPIEVGLHGTPSAKALGWDDVPSTSLSILSFEKSEIFEQMKSAAVKYADANGYQNCAISCVSFVGGAAMGDMIFW